MARIRTIKPEFFTSEDIVTLSPLARLLYIATWCEADKEGRMLWKPKTLKMRYFPGDNCEIDALCAELVQAGLVALYGNGLAHIPGFAKHQHVNPRESRSVLPEPPTHVERTPSHIPADVREVVMARDGGKCVRCESDDHPQLDHILPQSCGGPHIVENLRVLCRSCNAGRPVAGAGLVSDLARDGFTLESLRCKFGIDASIPDPHAQGGREGKGREEDSVAKATGGKPPVDKSEDETKRELFDAGKSLLAEQGMPAKQTGSFIGKLAKDYGQAHALEAVRSAVVARPMGAAEYLKATCLRLAGERKEPVTVPSDEAARTAAYLAEQSSRVHDPPTDIGERLRAAKQAVSVGGGSLRAVA